MKTTLETLSLNGLRTGSPQTMGAIRLVPILRDDAPGDLRIARQGYGQSIGIASVAPRVRYASYIPHGLVVSHTTDGSQAALGARLGDEPPRLVTLHHRMVKAEKAEDDTKRFRMLPLHLAMEGYMALHFRGPEILWSEYSDYAKRRGLSPRLETSIAGAWIRGLDAATRIFENHPNQVGVIVFVAEALATVFVVSHPEDYRLLARSLLEDFFGEILYTYGILYPETPRAEARLDIAAGASLDDIARAVDHARNDWADYTRLLTSGLFDQQVSLQRVWEFPPFRLERFVPSFRLNDECHIGERIVRDDGTLEYLKTFRLSQAQIRRGHLLQCLADADWNLEVCAKALRSTKEELNKRLINSGFGALLARSK
jgi:hypothetical protein